MSRPKLAADRALVHLLRVSLHRWLRAAGFEAEAAGFDRMPAPITDSACTAWADEIARRNEGKYAPLGLRFGILANTDEGRLIAAAARKVPERTGDRALLELVTAAYGIGAPPWFAAVTAVETVPALATRVGLESLRAALAERRPDPVADALRLIDAIVRFRAEAAAPILDRAKTSRPTAALRQP